MLVDDITIRVIAGHGGRGAVAFNKNMMALGPSGGSGGHGGSVYFEGVPDIGALRGFRYKKEFEAESGREGRSQFRDGHNGADLVLKVPVGTVIHDLATKEIKEVTRIGERVLAVEGGNGGKGNFLFRGPHNTSPKQFQPGLVGGKATVRLELKLIADAGLIGLPNAGKSSLLNALTKAQSKVANYAFTTLEPHLGAYYGLIIADIPGIIEDASIGKGLGVKFLRHVERTKALFHLVSAESETPLKDYKVIRKELGAYNKEMLAKPEHVFLSKSDLADAATVKKRVAEFKKAKVTLIPLSIHDENSLKEVRKLLGNIIKEKTA